VLPQVFYWVRLLCLVLHLSADSCSPDTDRKRLKSPFPFLYLMVGIYISCRSFAMSNGSCLLTLKLHSHFQADGLFETSRKSNIIVLPWLPSGLDNFHLGHSIREAEVPFRAWVATPIRCNSIDIVHTVELARSTLAHSSNYRSVTDCVRSLLSNRKSKASLGFAVGSCCRVAPKRSATTTAYRQTPRSCHHEWARPHPLELVTCACCANQPEG
jgi:hypothetical protein